MRTRNIIALMSLHPLSIILLASVITVNPVVTAIRDCQMRENYEYENRWNEMCSDLHIPWGDCKVPVEYQEKTGVSFDDHVARIEECKRTKE